MQLVEGKRIGINIAGIKSVEICEELGEGGQGHVWKVKPANSKYPNYYVFKHVRLTKTEKKLGYDERIRREASVLIDSEYVIKCLGYSQPDGDDIVLLFPYEEGQNLAEWINENAKESWALKKRIFLNVLKGVRALHRAGIIHRDLKPQNILITKYYHTPRLLDFGLAKFLNKEGFSKSGEALGTYEYMAPEMYLLGNEHTKECYDLYSLGIILYELIVGKNPCRKHNWSPLAFFKLLKEKNPHHLLDLTTFRFDDDPNVAEVIRRSTMFEPTERLQNVDDMIALLDGRTAHPKEPKAVEPPPHKEPKTVEPLSQGKMPKVLDKLIEPNTNMELMYIPQGTFLRGAPPKEESCNDDEHPQYRVTVASFWMGKYPVTQAQWQKVMGKNPSHFKGEHRPVECVSWDDAQKFCEQLNLLVKNSRSFEYSGRLAIFRLPSETEWEYACRAATTTPFYFGETINPNQANYDCNHLYGKGKKGKYRKQTTDVGSFPANAWGLCDMHGNVWEWCADTYYDSYTGAPTDGSVRVGLGNEKAKVLRGSSWRYAPKFCRSASRLWYVPTYWDRSFGLRGVCEFKP